MLARAPSDLIAERGERYGDPAVNLTRTAKLWSAILGGDVSAQQVALCMVAVKLSRLSHTPDDADSIADLAGYAEILRVLA
jgi:hypothetical protein